MKRFIPLLLLTGMITLSACRNDIVYSSFTPISSAKWHIDSIASFDFLIEDTTLDYSMLIYLRHTERYPYQNMWLFVGDSLYRDTIEFYLADDRGQWLGDKKHGFIEMPVLFEENKHFESPGTYSLQIQQGMRDSLLNGVTDIGLEIRSNGKK